MKGLLVHVLRSARLGDCTNGGVSAERESFVLVKNGAELGPFEPSEKNPALFLARWYGRVIACPANLEELCPVNPSGPRARARVGLAGASDRTIEWLGNWMAGGNFVYSCDSRYREAVGEYPIEIYDRREA